MRMTIRSMSVFGKRESPQCYCFLITATETTADLFAAGSASPMPPPVFLPARLAAPLDFFQVVRPKARPQSVLTFSRYRAGTFRARISKFLAATPPAVIPFSGMSSAPPYTRRWTSCVLVATAHPIGCPVSPRRLPGASPAWTPTGEGCALALDPSPKHERSHRRE